MRCRLIVTIDTARLEEVLTALGTATSEITVNLMPEDHPVPQYHPLPLTDTDMRGTDPPTPSNAIMAAFGTKKRATRATGGEWPAEGSIYGVVMASLKDESKTPEQLRGALKQAGFSTGSLNSALGRLEKHGKAKKVGEGMWSAA